MHQANVLVTATRGGPSGSCLANRMRFRRRLDASWQGEAVATQMLAAGKQALEQDPTSVYPFWLLLEAVRPIPLPAGASFLELGCGTGHNLALLQRELPGRFRLYGSDYSPQMLELAAKEVPSADFFVSDIFDPDLDLSPYDVVCAAGLIEVVREWERALENVLAAPAEHIILHRQRMATTTRVDRETHYLGRETYCLYLAFEELEARARAHGWRIALHAHKDGELHHTFLLSRD